MNGSVFFTLISNASPGDLVGAVETLMFEYANGYPFKPVLVNLDTAVMFRARPGRAHREEPVSRYGKILGNCAVPLLDAKEAEVFFEDTAKSRDKSAGSGRAYISISRKKPTAETLALCDALCVLVPVDASSTAFVYDSVKAAQASGRSVPVRILVTGEPKVECCAEFYSGFIKEFKSLGCGVSGISFAGHLFLDPEEADLAAGFGLSTIEVYPESTLRGQARQAVRRLFACDQYESEVPNAERIRPFLRYLRSAQE
jgi:hypothetical protein